VRVTKRKKDLFRFFIPTKDHLAEFSEKKNGWCGDPFHLKFWVNGPDWSEIVLNDLERRDSPYFAFFHRIREIFRPIISQWLKIEL